jgi:hypothetical protein
MIFLQRTWCLGLTIGVWSDPALDTKGMWDRMKFTELFTKPKILVC